MAKRSTTSLISLRVNRSVLEWFRTTQPKGYQTLMNSVLSNYVDKQREMRLRNAGRAQEIFRQHYAQCFWHLDPNLEITPDNLQLVIDGLRKYGGRSGFLLADELCQ